MSAHSLSKNQFLKLNKLGRNSFCARKVCDIYVIEEVLKSHESTRDQKENAKNHLGYRNRASDVFPKVGKIIVPERRID